MGYNIFKVTWIISAVITHKFMCFVVHDFVSYNFINALVLFICNERVYIMFEWNRFLVAKTTEWCFFFFFFRYLNILNALFNIYCFFASNIGFNMNTSTTIVMLLLFFFKFFFFSLLYCFVKIFVRGREDKTLIS